MRVHDLAVVGGLLAATLPALSPAVAQEAADIYKDRCLACHGETGKGDTPVGTALHSPDLSDAKRMTRIADARLTEVIIKGSKNMPGFGSLLTPAEVHALVVYIRSLSQPKPPS